MLFDEPASALDPEMIREIVDVIDGLPPDGMTMLVVTREMGFAREVAGPVVVIVAGEIADIAESKEFFDHPKAVRTKDFLSQILGR